MYETYDRLGGFQDFRGCFDSLGQALYSRNKLSKKDSNYCHYHVLDTVDKIIYAEKWEAENIKVFQGFTVEIIEIKEDEDFLKNYK